MKATTAILAGIAKLAADGRTREPTPCPPPLNCSEAEFQSAVVALAHRCGWLTYHTHDSRRSASGYPDLTMVRGSRIIVAELKSARGRVSKSQQAWLEAFAATGAAVVRVWRPGNWRDVVEQLA